MTCSNRIPQRAYYDAGIDTDSRHYVELLQILVTLAVALAGFLIGRRIGIPVPAMVGSMVAVGCVSAVTGFIYMPSFVKIFSQGISGAFIGMMVSRRDIENIPHMIKPILILLAMLTANTIVLGFAFHAIFGWDLTTALLSCVAGGVADVSLIAMDMDADASTVALMQTVRLAGILLIFPSWIAFMTRNQPETDITPMETAQFEHDTALDRVVDTPNKRTAFTLVLSILCGAAGYASGIPAGAMTFSLVTVVIFNMFSNACRMPLSIRKVAQLLAGSLVGSTVTHDTIANLGHLIAPLLIMFAMYMLVNLAFSLIASKTGMLDLRSALFASSPGGATDMSLIASDLGADLTRIAVMQIIRAAYAAGLMPHVVMLVVSLAG